MLDPLFSAGFLHELLRRLPPALAQEVERFNRESGFDLFCCAFLTTREPMRFFTRAIAEALKNARQHPDQLEQVRREVYSRFTLRNGGPA